MAEKDTTGTLGRDVHSTIESVIFKIHSLFTFLPN